MDVQPRNEYPRPQFRRDDWLCLNGEWEFEIDPGDSGEARGLPGRELSGRITVPFCPESELSGIGNTDFLNAVWYRRRLRVPEEWAGREILLHFQAVDYEATVWVNGAEVGNHRGGSTPFTCNISACAPAGAEAEILLRARDDHRSPTPKGKQATRYGNYGCRYTRTTGIWQTVWLEPVPACRLERPRIVPDFGSSSFRITQPLSGSRSGRRLRFDLLEGKKVLNSVEIPADRDFAPAATLPIPPDRVKAWRPGRPHLYGLEIRLLGPGGALLDRARSYAGLRSITIDGRRVLLNGEPLFQRLVLDQGYYPDGLLTAPSDAALRRDIEIAQAAGFNGARLHEKVFEERFLYHADRLGYLVWSEFPDWVNVGNGAGSNSGAYEGPDATFVGQWLEAVMRDISHPSIVGWCPLNETHREAGPRGTAHDEKMRAMFLAARAADSSRPILDASGYSHQIAEADIFDVHDYCQDPDEFAAHHAGLPEGRPFIDGRETTASIPYGGQPYFVSEFGGTWWDPQRDADRGDSWGYGQRPETVEEVYSRFEGLCGALLRNPEVFGYCYTQLTDVFQEKNGIYTFEREPKFSVPRLRAAQGGPAACEAQTA